MAEVISEKKLRDGKDLQLSRVRPEARPEAEVYWLIWLDQTPDGKTREIYDVWEYSLDDLARATRKFKQTR
jgi:hypothetical protein